MFYSSSVCMTFFFQTNPVVLILKIILDLSEWLNPVEINNSKIQNVNSNK